MAIPQHYENWLCKQCKHYKGMNDEAGIETRCGNPIWTTFFLSDNDYVVHNSPGRPNWCQEEVKDQA